MKITLYLYVLSLAFSFSSHSADAPKNEIPCAQCTYIVNVYFAETGRKGTGIAVFTDGDVRDTVKQNVQSIKDSLKTSGFAGNLVFRIPQRIGEAHAEPPSLLVVREIDSALSEQALKEAMIKYGEPASIIFFRQDPWQSSIGEIDNLILNAQKWQDYQTDLKRNLEGLKMAGFDVQDLKKNLSVKNNFSNAWCLFKDLPEIKNWEEEAKKKREAFLSNLLQNIEAPLPSAKTETKLLSCRLVYSSLTYESLDKALECHLKIRQSGITSCSQPLLVETEILFAAETLVVAEDLNKVVIHRSDNTHRILIEAFSIDELQEIQNMLAGLFQSQRNIQIKITDNDVPGEKMQNLIILGNPTQERIRTSLGVQLNANINFADRNLAIEALRDAEIISVYRQPK